ncbi:hypothetical protein C5C44_01280 [Rathayibacter sp. AY1F6]|uniref:hypothetical protein n=1 Tax=Rathayibacter sp. AY1F6 TaxID=2080560 RepID=UPI000CE7B143|nr:hypothetical protein [Rathayibacter sp. AY1F6]PPH06225.1 hypothetical protein C5C44_01280 [Rathayibacter sp. AY1F6]
MAHFYSSLPVDPMILFAKFTSTVTRRRHKVLNILSIWARLALSVLLWNVLLPVMLVLLPFRTGRSASLPALRPVPVPAPTVAIDTRSTSGAYQAHFPVVPGSTPRSHELRRRPPTDPRRPNSRASLRQEGARLFVVPRVDPD